MKTEHLKAIDILFYNFHQTKQPIPSFSRAANPATEKSRAHAFCCLFNRFENFL